MWTKLSSGRLSTNFAKSDYKFFGDETDFESNPDHKHMAKYPVYGLRSYLSKLESQTRESVPSLDIKLSLPEIAAAKLELKL
jgi:hypothetical protein